MINFQWFELSCPACEVTTFVLLDKHESKVECSHCGNCLDRKSLEKKTMLQSVSPQVSRKLDEENAK